MSYEETTRIMGCSGSLVSPQGPASDEVSTIEWNGPGSILMATQLDFLDNVSSSTRHTPEAGGSGLIAAVVAEVVRCL
jgi:hypothetical protein